MCSLLRLSFSLTSFVLFSLRIYNLLRVAFNSVPGQNIFIISALLVIWKIKLRSLSSNVMNNCEHQLTFAVKLEKFCVSHHVSTILSCITSLLRSRFLGCHARLRRRLLYNGTILTTWTASLTSRLKFSLN